MSCYCHQFFLFNNSSLAAPPPLSPLPVSFAVGNVETSKSFSALLKPHSAPFHYVAHLDTAFDMELGSSSLLL